jgi:metallo-beta-lactamase family protein
MFQGSKTLRELNYGAFPFDPARIDAVTLTHAHTDHSGLLPKLVKHGFQGSIHSTEPTRDLCAVMLPDSGHIQEMDVEKYNRRRSRQGREAVSPIYTMEDAGRCLKQFDAVDYDVWKEVAPGITARYWNAGHMLGSASIELVVRSADDGEPLTVFFSGDIGPNHKLLQPDPEAPAGCDYVVCESTFGAKDRLERSGDERRRMLCEEVSRAAKKGGALLIPSFAVERTQEVVTDLMQLMDEGAIPRTAVFIDSPLANKASEVFLDHADELENGNTLRRAFAHPQLRLSQTVDDSKAIGRLGGFHIVIAASGMCDAGRIRHHLKNHLWRRETTVLIVGFQAQATLGRLLLDGARTVRIHGEDVRVRAGIRSMREYSGHADGPELGTWLAARAPIRRGLFLVHGEGDARAALAERLPRELLPQQRIFQPQIDDVYDLDAETARALSTHRQRRIAPDTAARLDWHNDLTSLVLDINETVEAATDERARGVIIRRVRRALEKPGK